MKILIRGLIMHFNVSMNKTINHAQDQNVKGLSNSDNFESFVNRSDMLLVLFSGKNGATVSSEVSKSQGSQSNKAISFSCTQGRGHIPCC